MTVRFHMHSLQRARGFSLVAAIFIVVVLASIGAFMVTIGEVQRQSPVGALQGARAYQAALAGVEWATFHAVQAPPCNGSTFSPTVAGLTGFTVAVTCTASAFTEGGANYNVYTIGSRATFGTFGTQHFYSRNLQATVTNASN